MDLFSISAKAVFQSPSKAMLPEALSEKEQTRVRRFHESIDHYSFTPFHTLPGLAEKLGVKQIYVKDESFRFKLNAFKALGATWALARMICQKLKTDIDETDFSFFKQAGVREQIQSMVFATATDGNYGRGLAWAARRLGCRARVFMPAGTVPARVAHIEALGAQVRVIDVNYDQTVRMVAQASLEKGWHLVQDTAWEGYEKIPLWVVQGYTTMAAEVLDQIQGNELALPTHVFLQAGVGSMAAAVLGYYANALKDHCPAAYVIEPDRADCIYRSARAGDGRPRGVSGALDTMMAGLACGEPNPFAWNILRDFSSGFVSCSDGVAALGMNILARPEPGDPVIISGESGEVGPGLIQALMTDPGLGQIRENMGLTPESILLCFSTEGDTDPVNYQKIIDPAGALK
ncbi:MAG: diaminopropionate ammonia-lyase [Desulfobacter sp.]|nr:diaminopropionate ammonia-lyase [Desulfobacter sp.]